MPQVSGLAFVLLLLACSPGFPQDTDYPPKGQLIPAPACLFIDDVLLPASACPPDIHQTWLDDIRHMRTERLIRVGYDGSRYANPAFQWLQSAFMQPQLMVQDRYFYDPVAGKYTVDRYVDDLVARYGGIDAVLIWPTYPNMGIDTRNQHDMIRGMPGGIAGVRQMVADFHRRGVHVLFPMMMWDQGTRDPGVPWPQAIAELMKEINADGVNGDTQDGVPLAFSLAADKTGHPLVFQPEGSPSDEALAWNVMTWGQYGGHWELVPGVDKYRWMEPRHMVNISDRWNRDKTRNLQYAFFNGEGWEAWENIWGIWNGITPRDGEATRRVAAIERGIALYLTSPDWEPFYPTHFYGVFASRWPRGNSTAWTIVNRNEYNIEGRLMSVAHVEGVRYFDLYHGVELTPTREKAANGDVDVLSFSIEGNGYGAVLATRDAPDAKLTALMSTMKQITAKPLGSYSAEWKTLPQHLVEVPATRAASAAPANMIRINGGDYIFKVDGIEIEGMDWMGVDVQYPWEDMPRRFHEHAMHIKPFAIDKYPVTNAEFKEFLDASNYKPADAQNFLLDWHNGTYVEGWAQRPVTWVSQEDARAYAAWAGKRLPREWEWQYAAQGTDHRLYPWGNEWNAAAVPVVDKGRTLRPPDNVDAHPAGASPFGVMDLVGNVWQWTDEYRDDHTRAAILRGGNHYQPQGALWYFPQAYRNDQHGKLLLMAPSYDRSGTIGFRCVVDLQ